MMLAVNHGRAVGSGKGTNGITINAIGKRPSIKLTIDACLSAALLTSAFHVACNNAAKRTAINTIVLNAGAPTLFVQDQFE